MAIAKSILTYFLLGLYGLVMVHAAVPHCDVAHIEHQESTHVHGHDHCHDHTEIAFLDKLFKALGDQTHSDLGELHQDNYLIKHRSVSLSPLQDLPALQIVLASLLSIDFTQVDEGTHYTPGAIPLIAHQYWPEHAALRGPPAA